VAVTDEVEELKKGDNIPQKAGEKKRKGDTTLVDKKKRKKPRLCMMVSHLK